jgi:integrase/recombinase XerD
LATLLYHGIRREELCGLRVKDLHSRQGVMHIRVKGKRSKIRFIPVNPAAQRMIEDYLKAKFQQRYQNSHRPVILASLWVH